jgi:TusA-related sulfurtransferase
MRGDKATGKEARMDKDRTLDCYGLLCPMPIIKIAEAIKDMAPGQVLEVVATDEGILSDLPAWCARTRNECLGVEEKDGEYHGFVKKGS